MVPTRSDGSDPPTFDAADAHSREPSEHGTFRSAPLERSMGTYLSATVAIRLVNFGRIWLLTWFMTLRELGLLTLILAVVNVLIPLCSLGLNDAVARYVPRHEQRGTLLAFMRRSFVFVLGVTALGAGLMVVFAPAFGDILYGRVFGDAVERESFRHEAPALARLSAVLVGLSIVYFYLTAILKGLRMFGALSRMEILHSLLFLAGSLGAIFFGRLSAYALTVLFAASLTIPILYFGPRLFAAVANRSAQSADIAERGVGATLLRFSIWTTVSGATWQALLLYAAWYLTKIHGHEAVGVFNTMQKIGQFVLMAAVAVSSLVA